MRRSRRDFLAQTGVATASLLNATPAVGGPAPQKTTHTFKQVDDLAIKADVYGYEGTQKRPVVVYLHGGALINGRRDKVPYWITKGCRNNGYVLVSPDYRLAPETKLPELVRDIEDAFRWIRTQGPKLFHADPDRVAVVGTSAGGYLTLTAGFRVVPRPTVLVSIYGYGDLIGPWLTQPSPHPRHQEPKVSEAEALRQVAGPPIAQSPERKGNGAAFYNFCRQNGAWSKAVSGWDPRTQSDKFAPYMPLKNVSAKYPATLLIHGDRDTDVPHEQSELMAAALKKHKVHHRFISVPGAEHGLIDGDPQVVGDAYRTALAFFRQYLSE